MFSDCLLQGLAGPATEWWPTAACAVQISQLAHSFERKNINFDILRTEKLKFVHFFAALAQICSSRFGVASGVAVGPRWPRRRRLRCTRGIEKFKF